LLGAYLPHPIPGVLVTTERPLSIQRFTEAGTTLRRCNVHVVAS
jgi:hypothetical protein